MFEVNRVNNELDADRSNGGNNCSLMLNSKYNLTPPHYDGVQSLCKFDNYLFSCSRDMCIKKWSMLDFQCKQVNPLFLSHNENDDFF